MIEEIAKYLEKNYQDKNPWKAVALLSLHCFIAYCLIIILTLINLLK